MSISGPTDSVSYIPAECYAERDETGMVIDIKYRVAINNVKIAKNFVLFLEKYRNTLQKYIFLSILVRIIRIDVFNSAEIN